MCARPSPATTSQLTKARIERGRPSNRSIAPSASPTADETLSANIAAVADGMTSLLKSGLNRKAIVVLLKDETGVSKEQINRVLDGLTELKKDYCKND